MDLSSLSQWIAREVRNVILENVETEYIREVIAVKANDFTRRIDQIAEERAIECFKEKGVSAILHSEELGTKIIGDRPEIITLLDPLDGSQNFSQSIPFYSVSVAIGYYKKNFSPTDVQVGSVIDVLRGDLYHAMKGKGSFKNGDKIIIKEKKYSIGTMKNHLPQNRTRKIPHAEPLISLYIYGPKKQPQSIISLLQTIKMRTLGSIALELCYTASSKLDAVIDLRRGFRVMDIAAGKLILEEAGGVFKEIGRKVLSNILEPNNVGLAFIAARDTSILSKLLNYIEKDSD
ncbi:inositol monophosphatase family protein [[Eubacterium] cellulosolvens]